MAQGGQVVLAVNFSTIVGVVSSSDRSCTSPADEAARVSQLRSQSSSGALLFHEASAPRWVSQPKVGMPRFLKVSPSASLVTSTSTSSTSTSHPQSLLAMSRRFSFFLLHHALRCSYLPMMGHMLAALPPRADPHASRHRRADANRGMVLFSDAWSEDEMVAILEAFRLGAGVGRAAGSSFDGAAGSSAASSALPLLIPYASLATQPQAVTDAMVAASAGRGVIILRSVARVGAPTASAPLSFGGLLGPYWPASHWQHGLVVDDAAGARWTSHVHRAGQVMGWSEESSSNDADSQRDALIALVSRLTRVCELRAGMMAGVQHVGRVITSAALRVLSGCTFALSIGCGGSGVGGGGLAGERGRALRRLLAEEQRYQALLRQVAERFMLLSNSEGFNAAAVALLTARRCDGDEADGDDAPRAHVDESARRLQRLVSLMVGGLQSASFVSGSGGSSSSVADTQQYAVSSAVISGGFVWPSITAAVSQMLWEVEERIPSLIASHGGVLKDSAIGADVTHVLDVPMGHFDLGACGLVPYSVMRVEEEDEGRVGGGGAASILEVEAILKAYGGNDGTANAASAGAVLAPSPSSKGSSGPADISIVLAYFVSLYESLAKCRATLRGVVESIRGSIQTAMVARGAAQQGTASSEPASSPGNGIAAIDSQLPPIVVKESLPMLEGVVDVPWVLQCVRHWRLLPPTYSKGEVDGSSSTSSPSPPAASSAPAGPLTMGNVMSDGDRFVLGLIGEVWELLAAAIPSVTATHEAVAAFLKANAGSRRARSESSSSSSSSSGGSSSSDGSDSEGDGDAPPRRKRATTEAAKGVGPKSAGGLPLLLPLAPTVDLSKVRMKSSGAPPPSSAAPSGPAVRAPLPPLPPLSVKLPMPTAAAVTPPTGSGSQQVTSANNNGSGPAVAAAGVTSPTVPTPVPSASTTTSTSSSTSFDHKRTSIFDPRSPLCYQLLMAAALMPPSDRATAAGGAPSAVFNHLPYSMFPAASASTSGADGRGGRRPGDDDALPIGWWVGTSATSTAIAPYLPIGYLTDWCAAQGLPPLSPFALQLLAPEAFSSGSGAVSAAVVARLSLIPYAPRYITAAFQPDMLSSRGQPLLLGFRRGHGLVGGLASGDAEHHDRHHYVSSTSSSSAARACTSTSMCACDHLVEAELRFRAKATALAQDAADSLDSVWKDKAREAVRSARQLAACNEQLRAAHRDLMERYAVLGSRVAALEDRVESDQQQRTEDAADVEVGFMELAATVKRLEAERDGLLTASRGVAEPSGGSGDGVSAPASSYFATSAKPEFVAKEEVVSDGDEAEEAEGSNNAAAPAADSDEALNASPAESDDVPSTAAAPASLPEAPSVVVPSVSKSALPVRGALPPPPSGAFIAFSTGAQQHMLPPPPTAQAMLVSGLKPQSQSLFGASGPSMLPPPMPPAYGAFRAARPLPSPPVASGVKYVPPPKDSSSPATPPNVPVKAAVPPLVPGSVGPLLPPPPVISPSMFAPSLQPFVPAAGEGASAGQDGPGAVAEADNPQLMDSSDDEGPSARGRVVAGYRPPAYQPPPPAYGGGGAPSGRGGFGGGFLGASRRKY